MRDVCVHDVCVPLLCTLCITYHFCALSASHTTSVHSLHHIPLMCTLCITYHLCALSASHTTSVHSLHIPLICTLCITYHLCALSASRQPDKLNCRNPVVWFRNCMPQTVLLLVFTGNSATISPTKPLSLSSLARLGMARGGRA
jgi:hypothetical protein